MSPANPNDPFSDPFAAVENQRTFVMPNPGARAPATPQPGAMPSAGAADVTADLSAPDTGLNPLLALANPLLAVVPQIRSTSHLPDPGVLKESLAQGLREFDAKAPQQGIAPERVMAARYILCTLLDEAAASTPWGGSGAWGRYSLLAMFHNETGGGEKVFQLMAKLAENPAANRDLLELIYAALCLGFQGRYRVVEGGLAQLEAVRDRLAQILKKERGGYAQPLAEHWRGQALKRRPFLTWLPLWVTGAVAAAVLLGLYFALSMSLGGVSDPTFGQIQSLRLLPPTPTVVQPAPKPRLAQFLASEIKAGLVAVRDDLDRSVITIRGDGLFDPGSASLSDDREALMKRIAEALAQVQGQILVTGHTDNQPIRSVRFPSNWHLSEERAKAVRGILVSRGVAPARVVAEGRADGEPVVANDTSGNRSINRRVEVTLVAARTGAAS
ncbi:MAG: DotU family type VI secretion system protein [Burkholderiales bacterium]|nr:DotU family type VI secretion system protein [Burkholderiales bacterium]